MKGWMKSTAALFAMLVAAVFVVAATPGPERTKLTKQIGGSTGDSVTAAADTTSWFLLKRETTGFWVVAANDSNTIYKIQVSPDTTNWVTVDTDTVLAGTAESSADFGSTYASFAVRVIQDMIPAGGADFGAVWTQITEE